MKTAIVYYSKHHGNTKKLLDEIAKAGDVTLIDASAEKAASLYGYDLIGFASGIYFGKYHKSVIGFAEEYLPEKRNVFFIHTAGVPTEKFNASVKKITDRKNCRYLGTFFCKGYDSYGPFKLVGGIGKGHPNESEIKAAAEFYKGLAEKP